MLTGTLCCVVLFLWEVEPADAGVSQAPRHEVTEVGQSVTLRCQPISGHESLYWYRQTLGQGLEFLVYFHNGDAIDESGMPKDRFSAKMLNTSFSTLKIQPTGPRDSATYVCASSVGTALQSHLLSVQKTLASPSGSSPHHSESKPYLLFHHQEKVVLGLSKDKW
uniref:Ig-like domain-containing protein n=2 Tax=Sus scrofa TaxID=9823 RepID=A0A8D1G6C6_PIG